MTDLQPHLDAARSAGFGLVRVVAPIACEEPWSLARVIQSSDTRVMAWSAPSEGPRPMVFIAAGIAAELRPCGGHRFEEASRWWAQTVSQIVELDGQTGATVHSKTPVCLAGFAFAAGLTRSQAWQGWNDGAICIPEILVIKDAQGTRVVYTLPENQGMAELLKLEQQLQGWLGMTQPEIAPAPANGAVQDLGPETSDWSAWRARVESAQSSLKDGTMDKVVLARSEAYRTDADATFDPLGTALALRNRQSDSTTFMIQRKDGQAFLGATPEILVRMDSGRVETVAMAGTRRRGTAEGDDAALGTQLLDSPKDRHEQQLVADAICQALGPVVSDLKVPAAPEVVRLPDVQHLRTAITGRVTDRANIFDLLMRLHPTPAVGGLPRESALQWLDDHESLDRGWYAGPIGWVDAQGNGEFVVAIRSVLMADHEAAAFAGCGLVAHSNARDEWDESVVKLQTVRRGLALRPGAES
jgi:salicylate biosynthesis isochorismate synthase